MELFFRQWPNINTIYFKALINGAKLPVKKANKSPCPQRAQPCPRPLVLNPNTCRCGKAVVEEVEEDDD